MELQRKISSYFNGEEFPKNVLKNKISLLKKSIIKETGETKFLSFSASYQKKYHNLFTKEKVIVKFVKPFIKTKTDKFLKPLNEFVNYIRKNFKKEELVGAYIHGSLATNDYVSGYSDFDAILIIKEDVMKDDFKMIKIRNKIKKANTFLYLLDPLQHHNLFIITELDMKYYFQPTFPIELFNYAREITNYKNILKFRCFSEDEHLDKIFLYRIDMFSNPKKYKLDKKNVYDIKNAVQNILLLPALYLQGKNKKYLYKKYSFNKAKKDFSRKEWEIIERCSQLRRTFSFKTYYPYFFRKFLGTYAHYKILKALHLYLDRNNTKEMMQILGENFLYDAKKLSKKMYAKIKDGR